MRIHTEIFTADDADALAGTILDTLEAPGQLDIFILSTQADTRVSLTGPGVEPLIQNGFVAQETRAPRPNDDLPYSIPINTTGHFTLDINIVTAATVQLLAVFRDEDDIE